MQLSGHLSVLASAWQEMNRRREATGLCGSALRILGPLIGCLRVGPAILKAVFGVPPLLESTTSSYLKGSGLKECFVSHAALPSSGGVQLHNTEA